jgi:F420-non-reducing hydrogenase iron-sulfur subunit
MLEALGLERERYRLVWCSSAEADRFVAAMRDMTDRIRSLGPSPYRYDFPELSGQKEVVLCR